MTIKNFFFHIYIVPIFIIAIFIEHSRLQIFYKRKKNLDPEILLKKIIKRKNKNKYFYQN